MQKQRDFAHQSAGERNNTIAMLAVAYLRLGRPTSSDYFAAPSDHKSVENAMNSLYAANAVVQELAPIGGMLPSDWPQLSDTLRITPFAFDDPQHIIARWQELQMGFQTALEGHRRIFKPIHIQIS